MATIILFTIMIIIIIIMIIIMIIIIVIIIIIYIKANTSVCSCVGGEEGRMPKTEMQLPHFPSCSFFSVFKVLKVF